MTYPSAIPRPSTNDIGCGLWCLVTVVVLLALHRYLVQPPLPLLDCPNERSHPQWKSSSNLCQRSNLTTATRA